MGVKAKTNLPAKDKDNIQRLGQKFGVIGEELSFTLAPPKRAAERSSDADEDLMITLQKIYDLFEAEPGLNRDLKEKVARILAQFYNQEEPGFTADEAFKAIIRDYQIVRDIPDLSAKSRTRVSPSSQSKKKNQLRNAAAPVKPASASTLPGGPTLADILSGKPFGPQDFMSSQPLTAPQRMGTGRLPVPKPTAGMPMMGMGSPVRGRGLMMPAIPWGVTPGRRFRPMGFMMGPGMPPPGLYGRL